MEFPGVSAPRSCFLVRRLLATAPAAPMPPPVHGRGSRNIENRMEPNIRYRIRVASVHRDASAYVVTSTSPLLLKVCYRHAKRTPGTLGIRGNISYALLNAVTVILGGSGGAFQSERGVTKCLGCTPGYPDRMACPNLATPRTCLWSAQKDDALATAAVR